MLVFFRFWNLLLLVDCGILMEQRSFSSFYWYTDHIRGSKALLEDHPDSLVEVYAHSTLKSESKKYGNFIL